MSIIFLVNLVVYTGFAAEVVRDYFEPVVSFAESEPFFLHAVVGPRPSLQYQRLVIQLAVPAVPPDLLSGVLHPKLNQRLGGLRRHPLRLL